MIKKKGMTIIEVVVALAIFMILIVMAFPIITQSGLINAEASKRQKAEAQGVLLAEYLLYNSSNYANTSEFMINFLTKENIGSDFRAFTCSTNECSLVDNDFEYKIKFADAHKVLLSVKHSRQVYESVVWLSYA